MDSEFPETMSRKMTIMVSERFMAIHSLNHIDQKTTTDKGAFCFRVLCRRFGIRWCQTRSDLRQTAVSTLLL